LLRVEHINTFYGRHQALWDVSVEVSQGEIVAIIGSNGAGKSTFLKTVAGLLRPKSGTILYNGTDITAWPANRSVRGGITLCPEGRKVFPALSVWENLRLGAYTRPAREMEESFTRVYELFPILRERSRQAAGTLSGGEQQMLAIARAMMSNPNLLMLDEPSLGLSPVLTEKIFELILEIRRQGYTIILVEQNAVMALSIAERAYALQNGRISASGTGEKLLASSDIVNSYLG
jgi:branched-chain amino acid transport system ATP-binding protein